ncbi:MAG TPA: hypothetical protein VF605_13585 [Allosphingosinicella sp.]|jgi:hypothetical protein
MADEAIPEFCSALEDSGFQPGTGGFQERAALLNAAFWGRGVRLRVSFLEGTPELQRRVAGLAKLWETQTGANFTFEFWIANGRNPREADIRIAFRPDKGSNSVLGRYARSVDRDKRTMNLGWMTMELDEDRARAVVLHEFGHALGLIHEHMSPSQPINWNKEKVREDMRRAHGWEDDKIDANMFAKYRPREVFATPVDARSIMMYPIPPEWTTDGFTAPFNPDLTPTDIALVREAYGVRPAFGG